MSEIQDPQFLLQPWNGDLQKFSEELYARASAPPGPVTQTQPMTIQVQQGTALEIVSGGEPAQSMPPQARPAEPATGQVVGRARQPQPAFKAGQSSAAVESSRDSQAGSRRGLANTGDQEVRSRTGASDLDRRINRAFDDAVPALRVKGGSEFQGKAQFEGPARFKQPPEYWDNNRQTWYSPSPWPIDTERHNAAGSGPTVFVGLVSSASSSSLTVDLYGDGSNYNATDFGVTVKIIDPDTATEVSSGDWVAPIFAYNDAQGRFYYQAQPSTGSGSGKVFLGKVGTSYGGGIYDVELFERGAENDGTRLVSAKEASGDAGVTELSWVVVLKITYTGEGGSPTTVYEFVKPGGAGNVTLGKVTNGSGNTYTVELYGNGSAQPATGTVTATVPQIYGSATIPVGTWVSAVYKFGSGDSTTYEFQPPVWLS